MDIPELVYMPNNSNKSRVLISSTNARYSYNPYGDMGRFTLGCSKWYLKKVLKDMHQKKENNVVA